MTGPGALPASPYGQALGLGILSVLLSALLVVAPGTPYLLPDPAYQIVLLLACGTMLAAFTILSTRPFSSRLLGILLGAAAYLLIGFLYGNVRYAITQDRAFLIGMAPFIWPWLLVWDAGCLLGIWHCVTIGN